MSNELINHFLRTVQIDDVMTYLTRISAYDRYQASHGIEEAASLVADTAHAIGLAQVSVEHFPADGTAQWWSFQAPVSWTPTVARLEIHISGGRVLEVDHARQPFSVATYSAATPPGGVVTRLVNVWGSCQHLNLTGAIAVVGRTEFAQNDLLPELISGGALGFVTDAPCCSPQPECEYPGRIELDPRSSLFGFSLTSSQLERIRTWTDKGAEAHVVIDVDRSASMPVVTGILPGKDLSQEVWLTAHLCHPRPGANDNASGVAALLGIAAAHMASRQIKPSWGSGRTIRFLWGPEFLGVCAMLHKRMSLFGREGLPLAVINLDMVGENQSLCGCPFIVERSPDCYPALISPISEHIVGQVFAQTGMHHGKWRPSPFLGFSDHALFSDPSVNCAAVQFCHAPDRFNHSSGDSLDKVSDIEMLRATAAGATLAHIMANDNILPQPLLEQIVRSWCFEEHKAAQLIAQKYYTVDEGDWGQRLIEYIGQRNAVMLSLLNSTVENTLDRLENQSSDLPDESTILRRWSGPINIRAMLADLPCKSRLAVSKLIRDDKKNYALLLNFAIRVDGNRSRNDIINETSFALQRPINKEIARQLFDTLLESGWITEVLKNGNRSGGCQP